MYVTDEKLALSRAEQLEKAPYMIVVAAGKLMSVKAPQSRKAF